MNMGLTKRQERGFELFTKGMKKKFPYIEFIEIEEIGTYHIWVILGVEMTRFLKYYKVPGSEFHTTQGLKFSKEYFNEHFRNGIYYMFPIVHDDFDDDFTIEFNYEMDDIMNGLYSSLPEEYRVNEEEFQGEVKAKKVKVNKYKIEVDVNGEYPTHTKS